MLTTIRPVFTGNVEHTVTGNPRPKNHGKPSNVIIPLHDWRDVYMYNGNFKKTTVQVFAGEIIIFAGDVAHGGCTYHPVHPFRCHPSFHASISSKHHMKDLSEFEINIEVIGNDFPQLLPQL